jgi:hypothetical protein
MEYINIAETGNLDQPMHLFLMLKPVDWKLFIKDWVLPVL